MTQNFNIFEHPELIPILRVLVEKGYFDPRLFQEIVQKYEMYPLVQQAAGGILQGRKEKIFNV
jgi:hypothetical protein